MRRVWHRESTQSARRNGNGERGNSPLPLSSHACPLEKTTAATMVGERKSEKFSRAEKMIFSRRSVNSISASSAAHSRSPFCHFLSIVTSSLYSPFFLPVVRKSDVMFAIASTEIFPHNLFLAKHGSILVILPFL